MGTVGADPHTASETARRAATEQSTADVGGVDDHVSDAILVARARTGDVRAFDALYRRHHEPAWRLALVVTSSRADAEDAVAEAFAKVLAALPRADVAAFRPYLLRCVRNAATDAHRRTARLDLRDEVDLTEGAGPARRTAPAAEELADAGSEAALAVAALNALPERWRTVLWLTEVEEMGPADAGQILGLSANATAGLSFRAREGLRRAYLAAHLRPGAPAACAAVARELPAYARGMLAARARDRVDAHLEDCADCRRRLEDLDEVNRRLAGLLLPAPLLLQPLARLRWSEIASAPTPNGPLGAWLDRLTRSGPVRSTIGAAVVVLLLGGALVLIGPDAGDTPVESQPVPGADRDGGTAGGAEPSDGGMGSAEPQVAGEPLDRPFGHGPGPDGGPPHGIAPGPEPAPDPGGLLAPDPLGAPDQGGPGADGPAEDQHIPANGPGDQTEEGSGPGIGGGTGGNGNDGGNGNGNGGGNPPPGGSRDPGTVAGAGIELGQGPVGVVVGVVLTDDGADVDVTVGDQQVLGDAPPAGGTCVTVELANSTHPVLCPDGVGAASVRAASR